MAREVSNITLRIGQRIEARTITGASRLISRPGCESCIYQCYTHSATSEGWRYGLKIGLQYIIDGRPAQRPLKPRCDLRVGFGTVRALDRRVPSDNDPRHGRVIHQSIQLAFGDGRSDGINQM